MFHAVLPYLEKQAHWFAYTTGRPVVKIIPLHPAGYAVFPALFRLLIPDCWGFLLPVVSKK
jgi:hypothetical protein